MSRGCTDLIITKRSLRNKTATYLRHSNEHRPVLPGANIQARCVHNSQNDDDNDDEMAHQQTSSLFAPQTFSGSRQEDAGEWLETVRHWLAFKAYSEAQRCAAFPLLLRDGASGWYRELTDAVKNDFDRLTHAFVDRYRTNAITAWQDTAAAWTLKQGPQQTVDEYLDAMEKCTYKTNMLEEQKCHAMINGLRGNIRQQVLQHDNLDKQNIRKWALIAEAGEATPTDQHDVTAALKALQQQIGRLELRTLASPIRHQEDRRRSPSPRMRFDDDDHRYNAREASRRDDGDYHRYDERAYRRRDERDLRHRETQHPAQRFRSNSPPGYRPQYQPTNQNFSRRTPSPGPAPYRPANRTYSSSNRPSRAGYNMHASNRPIFGQGHDASVEGNCHRCLGPKHSFSRCPASNAQCAACLRTGHWASACRNTSNQP